MTAVDGILKAEGIAMSIVTMHQDLRESIRKESEGSASGSQLHAQGTVVFTLVLCTYVLNDSQWVQWRLLPGSTATTPTPIT